MNDSQSPSSREELERLREEGKITEEEHEELFDALNTSRSREECANPEHERTRKLGWLAVGLVIAGILLPLILYLVIKALAPPNAEPRIGMPIWVCLLFQVFACYLGVKAWRSKEGKAAAIGAPLVIVILVLIMA